MWASNAFSGFSLEEIGIVVAPYEAAGVLIDWIVDVNVPEVGHGKEAGHVGVVHQKMVPESIYLVGVDLSVFGMVVDRIFLKGFLNLGGEVITFLC